MKQILSLTLVLVPLLLSACSKPPAKDLVPAGQAAATAKPNVVIGISVLTMTNPFFVELAEAMKQEAAKHDYEVIVTAGEHNVATQMIQVNEFIVKQVDAIVLCPCDSQAIGTSIAAANKAGIPVFTADIACLAEGVDVVCHVATDNYGGGKLAGGEIVDLLAGQGKVAIIDYPEVESVILRTKGFREVVGKIPGMEIVGAWPGQGDRVISAKEAEGVLLQHSDLDAFFAINDPSGVGVAVALEEAGKADRIKIVSFDAQPMGREAVKAGKIHATIVQYPKKIGATVIDAVVRYMNAEEVEKEILIPCAVYRKEDADKDPTLKEE